MKKLFVCLLAVAAIAFVGCKKDNDSSPDSAPASFTCKIDNVLFTGVVIGGGIQAGTLNVTGKAADSSFVTITVLDDVVGIYNLGLTGNEGAVAFYAPGGASSWTSNAIDPISGSSVCTISTIDTTNKKISGTFNGTLLNGLNGTTKVITEGVFTNVPYSTSGFTGSNTFAVKYDGTSLVPTTISGAYTSFNNSIALTASDDNFVHSVGLNMPATITPGTYSIGTIGATYYGTFNSGSNYMVSNTGSGNIVITSHNTTSKRIAGTFNFTASSFSPPVTTSTLTNGSFDITYN